MEKTHVGESKSNIVIVAGLNDHIVISGASRGSNKLHTTLQN